MTTPGSGDWAADLFQETVVLKSKITLLEEGIQERDRTIREQRDQINSLRNDIDKLRGESWGIQAHCNSL